MGKSIHELASELRAAGRSFSESGMPSEGGELSLVAASIEALERKPPTMDTKDFAYGPGNEVSLDDLGDSDGLERMINGNDLLPVWFLEKGVQMQRSVARVVLTKSARGLAPGDGWGTGFLISPSLFLTNNHVIPNTEFNRKVRIEFNYQRGPQGFSQPTESYLPDPDALFHTYDALDYTVVRLKPMPPADSNAIPGQKWGFIPLNESPQFHKEQRFNVIQHPRGRHKEIALQNNGLHKLFEHFVRYEADTQHGSSGSPVFDNQWQLVALHHAGGEKSGGKWINNQGVRIDSIIEDMRSKLSDRREVLVELGIA